MEDGNVPVVYEIIHQLYNGPVLVDINNKNSINYVIIKNKDDLNKYKHYFRECSKIVDKWAIIEQGVCKLEFLQDMWDHPDRNYIAGSKILRPIDHYWFWEHKDETITLIWLP